MTLASVASVFEKRYRPIVYVLCAFGGCAWLVVGAVGQFTTMVDQRALHVVETFSAKPLAEHAEFRRELDQHDKEIGQLLESVQTLDRAVNRLVTIHEEENARRGLQLRAAAPVRP